MIIAAHLFAALLALLLGSAVLMQPKGTPRHKLLGRIWVALMAAVALSSFWIFEIRRGNVRAHRGFMIGTFIGLAAAGIGALAPGRALYRLFFLA